MFDKRIRFRGVDRATKPGGVFRVEFCVATVLADPGLDCGRSEVFEDHCSGCLLNTKLTWRRTAAVLINGNHVSQDIRAGALNADAVLHRTHIRQWNRKLDTINAGCPVLDHRMSGC